MTLIAHARDSAVAFLHMTGVNHISPLVSHLTALGFGLATALVLFGQSPQFGLGLKPKQMIAAVDPELFKTLPKKIPADGYLVRDQKADVPCLISNTLVTMLKTRPTTLIRGPMTMAETLSSLNSGTRSARDHFPEFSIRPTDSVRNLPLCIKSTKVSYGSTE